MTAQHANGHARPVTLALHGPVSGWPQDDPGHDRTAGQAGMGRDRAGRWRTALSAIPVVLVNAVAFGAQLGFWSVHLPSLAGAVLVALAVESIAIYLAWQAHLAQLADDSALRLRLAAYSFALVIGAMNYSHYMAPGWRPTVAAVTFGMMSAVSPWLWSVHSRRVSRDALKADNQIEPHAVRLGMTRWTWHPVLSYRVMRLATWAGENRPREAIALLPATTAATEDATSDTTADGTSDSGHDTDDTLATAEDMLSVEEEAARDDVSPGAVRKRRERARKTQDRSTT